MPITKSSKKRVAVFNLLLFQDNRGSICPIEFNSFPFRPKRIYFIYDVKDLRGGHAHKKEEEIFICIRGTFEARAHDGKKWHRFKMTKPGQAVYTANMIWHEFDKFSKNAIMLAISSTPYDGQKGYIMDFPEFLSLCRKKSS